MSQQTVEHNRLRIFTTHGVDLTGQSGNQVYGTCPFTGKENKFYINTENLLWDSKSGGQSGNVSDFLRMMANQYLLRITDDQRSALALDRGLPPTALLGLDIGWISNRRGYSLPIKDVNGRVVDIRMYRPGNRLISTAGAEVGLWGAQELPSHREADVYLCEGEWDGIALRWLLKTVAAAGVVVALPGAGTLKSDWVLWLSGRRVHTLYDHDAPGAEGEQRAWQRLKSRVQQLTFTRWPPGSPDGFDTRDWVMKAIADNKPKTYWRKLHDLFAGTPRTSQKEAADDSAEDDDDETENPEARAAASMPAVPPKTKWTAAPTLDHVHAEFKKWLYLDNTDAIDIMLATAVSQQIDGEPIWMFLVGPPGSAKTETLSSLSWLRNVYMTSSVTPHSLISGANWAKGDDPSLIPKLNGKIMVVKDFTSILSMRDADKDEVFGILRDAYDGKCGKEFGNGVVRNYESRFTILAAVTPSIYAVSSSHAALGERFLKFGVGDNLVHRSENEIIKRAISNINAESSMRSDLADVVNAFLSRRLGLAHINNGHMPVLPPDVEGCVVALARFGARMRGTVTRDTYRNDIVTSRPSAEVGSRLGKQLAKLCQSIAVVRQRRIVTFDDYRLVKKVMLDTIPQRLEDMLRHILLTCPTERDTMSAGQLAATSRYPAMTVSRLLQDLNVLDIVRRINHEGGRTTWTVSNYIRECIVKAQLYKSDEDLNRPSHVSVRQIRRRARRAVISKRGRDAPRP